MSPEPVSIERLRALRQPPSNESYAARRTIPDDEVAEDGPPGLPQRRFTLPLVAGSLAAAAGILGWMFWLDVSAAARELEQTKLELAAAQDDIARLQLDFAEASVIHDLWGLSSHFASLAASACSAEDDRKRLREPTSRAIEMWSDSAVRSDIDFEGVLLPALRVLKAQRIQVVGASLPAGVLAQYRRFRREALGHVVMLDPARISDRSSHVAALEFLRKVAEGQLDPAKTSLLYQRDDHGEAEHAIVQGGADVSLLRVRLRDSPRGAPETVTAAGFPCS